VWDLRFSRRRWLSKLFSGMCCLLRLFRRVTCWWKHQDPLNRLGTARLHDVTFPKTGNFILLFLFCFLSLKSVYSARQFYSFFVVVLQLRFLQFSPTLLSATSLLLTPFTSWLPVNNALCGTPLHL
jgi:hypothetical protein